MDRHEELGFPDRVGYYIGMTFAIPLALLSLMFAAFVFVAYFLIVMTIRLSPILLIVAVWLTLAAVLATLSTL